MHKNTFCHVEIPSTDLDRTKTFYSTLFDWKFTPYGDGYMLFETPSQEMGGGFYKTETITAGQGPTVYVLIDEHEPYLQRVVELGGTREAIHEVPGMGWSSTFKDPDGNTVGLWKSSHA